MSTVQSRTFKSGNSAAVRLPKEVALATDIDVTIVRCGDVLTIYPARPALSTLLARLESLPRPSRVEDRDMEPLSDRPDL